jgi:tetratricopeptide (TPR) repeat protein
MKTFLRPIWFFLILFLYSSYSSAQTGSIYVTSKPTGANIFLDDNPIHVKTDMLIENIPIGTHTIAVAHREYGEAARKVEIKESLTATLHIDLQPKEIKKEVKKEPKKETKKEAEVEIKDADGYHSLGFTHFGVNRYDLAVADFTKAIELDPNYLVAYYNRGVAYFDLGQYDVAIMDFTKAMELGLRGKGTYHIRGLAYAKQGKYDLAIADFGKALEVDPNDVATYNNRGIAYLLKGQYEHTIKDLTRAIHLDSKNAAIYYFHLGFALDRTGDKESARHNFFKAREMEKDIIMKTAEFLEKATNPETKRFYAEEILSASQYIGVQSPIITKSKEIVEKMAPTLAPVSPPPPSRQNPFVKILSRRFIFIILSLLIVVGILLVLVIKFSPGRKKKEG